MNPPSPTCRRIPLTFSVALVAGLAWQPAGAALVAVSPGETDRIVQAASGCPTFSWSASPGATGYELAVLRLDRGEEPELVWRREVEGSATSWSPSRSECLAAGGRYAWTVRALGADAAAADSEWAAVRRFEVAAAPGADELAAALATLERWRQAGGGPSATGAIAGEPRPAPATTLRRTSTNASAGDGASASSLASGVAAIRGENPDTSGSALGVLGIGHSPAGAAVVARNESSGADLVLDGEANAATDSLLRQDSLDRPSANSESFDFRNSGAGAMAVKIDGVDVVTTATDKDTLGALSCPDGQIAKRSAGIWQCANDNDRLSLLACASGQIAKVDPGGNWSCSPDADSLASLSCPDGQIAKRVTGSWACAPDDTGSAGIWTSYSEGADVRVFNAMGNRVAVGNRAIQPVGSAPTEDGALTVSNRAPLPQTTQYNLTMDGRGLQARTASTLFPFPQQDAPLLLNRYGGGVSIGKDTPPTRAALEAQGSIGNTMAMFQRDAGGQGIALVGDWPGLYANSYWNNGVQTMAGSGYSQLINFDQTDGAISFMTSTDPNTAADVPAATLDERLRLRKDGAVLSSLTQNRFNVVPLAQITLIWILLDNGSGALVVSELSRTIRSIYPVSLTWVSYSLNDFRLDIDFNPNLPSAPVPIVAGNSLDGYPPRWQGVSRDTTYSDVSVFLRDDLYSMAGRRWNFQIVIYGYN